MRCTGIGEGAPRHHYRAMLRYEQSPRVAWHQRTHSTARGREGRRQVLVADDHADSRESLAALLKLSGHAVHVASNGEEAIEMAEIYHPDVIFLDLNMPKASGFEVCERIRESEWADKVPIYALTSHDTEEDLQRSKAAGFDAHLTKPLDPDALPRLV
jgi:CheY-like chemotaxis protein